MIISDKLLLVGPEDVRSSVMDFWETEAASQRQCWDYPSVPGTPQYHVGGLLGASEGQKPTPFICGGTKANDWLRSVTSSPFWLCKYIFSDNSKECYSLFKNGSATVAKHTMVNRLTASASIVIGDELFVVGGEVAEDKRTSATYYLHPTKKPRPVSKLLTDRTD